MIIPFGEDWVTEGDTKNAPKYNSQELDKESGYYFYNARHYDPEIGRFVTPDTVIDGELSTQGWNRFAYCKGNPIVYKDPTGHLVVGGNGGPGYAQIVEKLGEKIGSTVNSVKKDVADTLQKSKDNANKFVSNVKTKAVDFHNWATTPIPTSMGKDGPIRYQKMEFNFSRSQEPVTGFEMKPGEGTKVLKDILKGNVTAGNMKKIVLGEKGLTQLLDPILHPTAVNHDNHVLDPKNKFFKSMPECFVKGTIAGMYNLGVDAVKGIDSAQNGISKSVEAINKNVSQSIADLNRNIINEVSKR